MSGQYIVYPEMNSADEVSILLCYILGRLDRPVTEEQLACISEDSGLINYFCFSDALDILVTNGSVKRSEGNMLEVTNLARQNADVLKDSIPLHFRKKLLESAFKFFRDLDNSRNSECRITEENGRCYVAFGIKDSMGELMELRFYAPDREQAEMIADNIRRDPVETYRDILGVMLSDRQEKTDVEKYL